MHAEQVPTTTEQRQASQLEWQRQCMSVLEQQSRNNRRVALKKVKAMKLKRSAAYDNIRAMDHAMTMAGLPLERFRVADLRRTSQPLGADEIRYAVPVGDAPIDGGPTPVRLAIKDTTTGSKRWEVEKSAIDRPLLVMTIDQGSQMFAGQFFLQHKVAVRLVVFPDPHHRTWNDALLGVAGAGLRYLLYEMLVCLNMPFGPWGSCVWWTELCEAWDSFLASSSGSQDDLFMSVYKHIASDLGQDWSHQGRDSAFTGLSEQAAAAHIWHTDGYE